jgi:hypothetical protein
VPLIASPQLLGRLGSLVSAERHNGRRERHGATTSPSIRPSSSTRTTSFDLRSAHRHRGHVGPGVLAHTDQHVVQRLMRAVQVGGRDLTDQLAIAS